MTSIRDDAHGKFLRFKLETLLLTRKRFNIEEYFGCLKDSPILDELAEYSKKLRESARVRI